MNIYKISQEVNSEYDTYDSAIVLAESEEVARLIHPDFQWSNLDLDDNLTIKDKLIKAWNKKLSKYCNTWVGLDVISAVKVEYLGVADDSIKQVLVLCASFTQG